MLENSLACSEFFEEVFVLDAWGYVCRRLVVATLGPIFDYDVFIISQDFYHFVIVWGLFTIRFHRKNPRCITRNCWRSLLCRRCGIWSHIIVVIGSYRTFIQIRDRFWILIFAGDRNCTLVLFVGKWGHDHLWQVLGIVYRRALLMRWFDWLPYSSIGAEDNSWPTSSRMQPLLFCIGFQTIVLSGNMQIIFVVSILYRVDVFCAERLLLLSLIK